LSEQPPLPSPSRNTTHWDYVMREMQWLAYDIGQERRWKRSAARATAALCAKHQQQRSTTKTTTTTSTKKKKQSNNNNPTASSSSSSSSLSSSTTTGCCSSSYFYYAATATTATSTTAFYSSLEHASESRLSSYREALLSYEKSLETHRMLSSLHGRQAKKHQEHLKVLQVKQELERQKRLYALSRQDHDDEYADDLALNKKKRKQQVMMYDADGNLVPVGKKKKSKKGSKMLLDGPILLGEDGLPLKKKKGSGKKKHLKHMQQMGMMGMMGHHPGSLLHDPTNLGMMGHLHHHPGSSSSLLIQQKKSSKGKGSRKDASKKGSRSKLQGFRKDSRTSPPFGEQKMEIAQMLSMPYKQKSASSLGTSKSKADAKVKQDLAALLKVQSKDSRKKSHGSSKKKSKATLAALAAQNDGSSLGFDNPPWSVAEDQVLMAVVYEFGSNWGLVADVLSCTYQLRDCFRRPHACRQRFKWICSTNMKSTASKSSQKQQQQQQAPVVKAEDAPQEKEKEKAKAEGEKDKKDAGAATEVVAAPKAPSTTTTTTTTTTTR